MEEPRPRPEPSEAPAPKAPRPTNPGTRAFMLVFAGAAAVLAAVTLGVEATTHMCADGFFDPIPTALHAVLIGAVPVTLALLVAALAGWGRLARVPLGALHGLATGVAFLYALVFLPLTPLGFLAVPMGGLGLLVLAPLASFAGLVMLRTLTKRQDDPAWIRRFWPGAAVAVLLIVLADLPHEVARVGLAMASSETTRAQGLDLLRSTDEEALRVLCYGEFHRPLDFLGSLAGMVESDPLEARSVYYAAYGRPFNALPRPAMPHPSGWGRRAGDWEQGGEEVGGRLAGLSLASSKMQGVVEGPVSYVEWTMEFRNETDRQAEARAEVALPPGGVVSRATLWVNGEEREAAYAGKAQVRQAYERIVAQRRDPLLVTSSGTDRVLVQCFPVPPKGTMRIKIGVTAPLQLDGESRLLLPRFADRNFDFDGAHEIAIPNAGSGDETGLPVTRPAGDRWWMPARGGGAIVATVTPRRPLPKTVVVAVDGSVAMEPHREALLEALAGTPYQVLVSTDGAPTTPKDLRTFRFAGGRDNVPLLREAARRAGPDGAILWIHAPQPEILAWPEPIACRIVEFPVSLGRDVVRRELRTEPVRTMRGDLGAELALQKAPAAPAGVPEVGMQLDLLWAAREVDRLAATDPGKAVKIAVDHRLVTSVSGAVVLETQEQYDQAGLQPVEPGTVPSIPEPAEWLLLAVVAAALKLRRRRA